LRTNRYGLVSSRTPVRGWLWPCRAGSGSG
jgi:hypothetical protein